MHVSCCVFFNYGFMTQDCFIYLFDVRSHEKHGFFFRIYYTLFHSPALLFIHWLEEYDFNLNGCCNNNDSIHGEMQSYFSLFRSVCLVGWLGGIGGDIMIKNSLNYMICKKLASKCAYICDLRCAIRSIVFVVGQNRSQMLEPTNTHIHISLSIYLKIYGNQIIHACVG